MKAENIVKLNENCIVLMPENLKMPSNINFASLRLLNVIFSLYEHRNVKDNEVIFWKKDYEKLFNISNISTESLKKSVEQIKNIHYLQKNIYYKVFDNVSIEKNEGLVFIVIDFSSDFVKYMSSQYEFQNIWGDT